MSSMLGYFWCDFGRFRQKDRRDHRKIWLSIQGLWCFYRFNGPCMQTGSDGRVHYVRTDMLFQWTRFSSLAACRSIVDEMDFVNAALAIVQAKSTGHCRSVDISMFYLQVNLHYFLFYKQAALTLCQSGSSSWPVCLHDEYWTYARFRSSVPYEILLAERAVNICE